MNLLSLCESRLNRNIKNNLDLLMKLQAIRHQRRTNRQTAPVAELHTQTATAGAAVVNAAEQQLKAA